MTYIVILMSFQTFSSINYIETYQTKMLGGDGSPK